MKALEPVARWVHALHGTKGLAAGGAGLLLLSLIEPVLGDNAPRLLLVGPVFALLVVGLFTLPREGVAAQQRALALIGDVDAAKKMARRLIWPVLLCIFLAPQFFLAAYGIPQFTPLAGVVLPQMQRRITLGVLFAILLLAVFYVRSSKGYAHHIVSKRPRDLPREDHSHQQRDLLLLLLIGLALAWGWLMGPFWRPFSLLEWPPTLDSLQVGVRGISSITFAIAIPLMLFMTVVAHLHLLWTLYQRGIMAEHRVIAALAAVHVAVVMGAIVLHGYDLLWIVQYRSAVQF